MADFYGKYSGILGGGGGGGGGTTGDLTDVGTDGIVITNGTGAVNGTGTAIAQHVADATHNGYLSSVDWNTFNGKGSGTVTSVSVVSANGLAGTVATATTTPAITLSTTVTGLLQGNGTTISAATTGNLTDAGTDGITITSGTGAVLGAGTSIAQHVADTTHNGYLSSTDWNTFNGKQSTISIGAFSSTPSAPGLTLTGAVLNLDPADATHPGAIALGAQTLGSGTKTVDNLIDSGLSASQAVVTDGSKQLTSLAYGTASSASSLIERDANQNAFANNFVSKGTNVVSAGGTTALTSASARLQVLTGTLNQTFTLPDATTLTIGSVFNFNNNSTGTLTVNDNSGGLVATLPGAAAGSGPAAMIFAIAVSTAAGSWDPHFLAPSGATSGKVLTAGGANTAPLYQTAASGTVTSVAMTVPTFLSVAGSPIISSGTLAVTLSGTALPIANGGTAATTAAAAFNNLSPMTTGGDIIYGGASGVGTRLANGTNGQVLTSSGGTAAPTWTTISSGSTSLVVQTKSANYTILSTDDVIFASGTITLTLPAASAKKNPLWINNTGTGVVTVSRAGSDLINGDTSLTISGQYSAANLISDQSSIWGLF